MNRCPLRGGQRAAVRDGRTVGKRWAGKKAAKGRPVTSGVVTPTGGARTRRRRATEVVSRLAEAYPGTAAELCALRHDGPFQLLVATILSAQCTDAKVNQVTPEVFASYPGPEQLAGADPGRLEEIIRPTGFFRSKTRSLMGMAAALVERFDGEVPTELDDLVTLPGVGRKTGNVVRSVAFDLPGLPVDTHVKRLSRRLDLVSTDDPVAAEHELNALVVPEERGPLSLRLILHGRRVCTARRPHCDECVLEDICPSSSLRAPRAPRRKAGASRSSSVQKAASA